MATSSFPTAIITKLKGRENFIDWQFAVQAYLEHEGLWEVVEGTVKDDDNNRKAKSKIILLVEPVNFIHIRGCETAKAIWDKLQDTFEDSGLYRRVSLIRQLTSTRLDNCNGMEDYVNKIISAAHKLRNIDGNNVSDEWIATFLLAGLSDRFKPMIMALENSNVALTSDGIKTKLLQDTKSSETSSSKALYTKGRRYGKHQNHSSQSSQQPSFSSSDKQSGQSVVRCYVCQEIGHISRFCPKKKKNAMTAISTGKQTSNSSSSQYIPTASGLFGGYSTATTNKNDWIIDSGASFNMSGRDDWLQNRNVPLIDEISAANNAKMEVISTGQVDVIVDCEGQAKKVSVNEVLHVPDLSVNLLSVSQMVLKDYTVVFDKFGCKIFDANNQLHSTGRHINNSFIMNLAEKQCHLATSENSTELWHRRMAHLNHSDLVKLNNGLASGITFNDKKQSSSCIPCLQGKQIRFPFPKKGSRVASVLDLIHSDLCGPMEVSSMSGARYFLTLIDDLSRKVFVYFLKTKEGVKGIFEEFKALHERQLGKFIKILRSDNGSEYVTNELDEFLRCNGIIHQTSNPYTPEQNGLAERMNRTLVEKARSMLHGAGLPKSFWAEAVSTAAYLVNRSPTSGHGKTPEEVWSGKTPDLSHLRVFGSKAMVHVPKELRRKLDSKSREMIFVGYCEATKGYRLIHPVTKNLTKSRNVVFLENDFRHTESPSSVPDSVGDFFPLSEANRLDIVVGDANANESSASNESLQLGSDASDQRFADAPIDVVQQNVERNESAPIDVGQQNVRRSERTPKPKIFSDFIAYPVYGIVLDDPQTVEEAMSRANAAVWKKAMKDEFDSLVENNTWVLTDLPPNRKPIHCKWVYKTKRNADGQVSRYKARLVAKGFTQRQGIDYDETYSPVIRYSSIRYLVAIAAKFDLDINQMDVVTAFLHGDIDEEIYMLPPPEFITGNKVCRLRKALYGLKQASRQWYLKLDSAMTEIGFQRSSVDSCIYYLIDRNKMTFVAVYIDDLLIFTNDLERKCFLQHELSKRFKMTNLGEAAFCVGLKLSRDRTNGLIFLNQRRHVMDLLTKFEMVDCNTVETPMDPNQQLSKDMSPKTSSEVEEMRGVPYQELVGGLLYISQGTRPDITYAVNTVSKYNNNPGKLHWIAAKRILRYLKKTIDAKLTFSVNGNSNILGYCDADWGSSIDDRKSCTGYAFIFQGGAISWVSKRQPTVALSTTEAEYMSLSAAVQESLWLRSLHCEFNFIQQIQSMEIRSDNVSALELAKSTAYSARTKHIDIRHHFVRQHVQEKSVILVHVPTEEMLADVLTKALPSKKHSYCSSGLGMLF